MKHYNDVDTLKEAILVANLHYSRMISGHSKVRSLFPLTIQTYKMINEDKLAYLDQFIFRFMKLQDSIGSRFIPSLLTCLGEDIQTKPFIDQLLLLEN